jgi:acyl-CoA thioesterase
MTVTEVMTNGQGITHGGFVFALADTAFAVACNGYGRTTVAADASITFISSTRAGDELVADAIERGGAAARASTTSLCGVETM